MLLTEYNEEKSMNLFFREGEKHGFKRGEERGFKRGEGRMAALISKLIEQGRQDELTRAVNDPAYREALYAELKL